MRIDPTLTWRKVEQRLARETDPRRRRNLETVLAHMKAEMSADLDGLMATVAEGAHYHAYAAPDPSFSPKGKAAVRAFYAAYVASGAHRLEFDIDRLVVDEDCVITEGVMRIAYPGSLLKMLGHAIDDPDAFYLYETRMATLWPFDENGMVRGEDTYTSSDGFAGIETRKLAPEDIATLAPA